MIVIAMLNISILPSFQHIYIMIQLEIVSKFSYLGIVFTDAFSGNLDNCCRQHICYKCEIVFPNNAIRCLYFVKLTYIDKLKHQTHVVWHI